MAGRVEGKVAFITGAARGQGRSHALRLAEEGADIIAVDVCEAVPGTPYAGATPEDLAETVRQVEALDRRIVAEQADVRDLDRLHEVVSRGVAELGRLDIVVANAGIDILGSWRDITPQIMRDTIDINLIGVWNTVMASVEHLVDGGGGSVVMTSSANGLKAGPFNIAYNASKYGVVALMKSFAMELAKEKVRVNSVHPGAVDTPMAQGAMPMFDEFERENPDLTGMFTQWIPGVMPPREISNAVLFLASDESTWVTGSTYAVDGGLSSY
ncbi:MULTISPECIES: mycofactocin-coupled SDR family oxidoreductase [unclassified Microbacterium]|uniref:mycofactocin-coupled SDR family oxidoreductase n=1 Tax=unclassified Microbacterium TaxID=2609290 RepID=UPI00097F6A62|nr:mycofactocin-coupled SDR family oxidoreductase [Microbacterium sp. JB110]RCS60801.1 NAD(P)-dependent oxidoreductase [Microbacterium sp. JB110]SJM64665.1 short-chain dehydrogenase/reductase SDR [Frigoribacterium sp. JB110]